MRKVYALFITGVLLSCADGERTNPLSTFKGPFPKRNINLANLIGDKIRLKRGGDTLELSIVSRKGVNFVIDNSSLDTIFFGRVSKFRGMYYLSQPVDDSGYWMSAVKISDHTISGLTNPWAQRHLVDEMILKGEHPGIVYHIDPDTTSIQLKADKDLIKKLFGEIIVHVSPDTILSADERPLLSSYVQTDEARPREVEARVNIYPNPVKTVLTIDISETRPATYSLRDLEGKLLMLGSLTDSRSMLDLSSLPPAEYIFIIQVGNSKQEQIRILKQ